MTPAEAAVISDVLRNCRSDGKALDEATVARMLAAVDGCVWVVEQHVDYEGETLLFVRSTEEAARLAAIGWHHDHYGDVADELNFAANTSEGLHFRAFSGSGELWLTRMSLAEPEKANRSVSVPSVCADCHVHPCCCDDDTSPDGYAPGEPRRTQFDP